jgi:hypothetical protein
MEQKNSLTLDRELSSDIATFCTANEIADVEKFMLDSFKNGYYIYKYGLMGEDFEIKPLEKVKEVLVEKDCSELQAKLEQLSETTMSLRGVISQQEITIKVQEEKINNLSGIIQSKLVKYHSTSNLKNTL